MDLEHWLCTNCGTIDGARAGLKCHGPGFTGICLALGETVVEISPGAFKRLTGAVEAERANDWQQIAMAQRDRANDLREQTDRLDALCRDAISLAEHLAGYVLPDAERGRFMDEIEMLRRVLNAEMNRGT